MFQSGNQPNTAPAYAERTNFKEMVMLGNEAMAGNDSRARALRARVLWWMARRAYRVLRNGLRRLDRVWAQDVAREQLRALNDRMLRDIGLQRGEIDGL